MEILFAAFDRAYLDRAFFWLKKQLSVYIYVESGFRSLYIYCYLFIQPPTLP